MSSRNPLNPLPSARRSRHRAGPSPYLETHLPKRNYGFEKRQKELAKVKKREEKRQRRAERGSGDPADSTEPIDGAEPPEVTEAEA